MSAHHRETAAGPSVRAFEMICAAYQSSDAALDVTLELINLIMTGELPRDDFLLGRLLIGHEKPGGAICGQSQSARRGIALRGYERCGRTVGAAAQAWVRCRRG